MAVALREAEVLWDGPLARGAGTLTSGSEALNELGVTWGSRTERPDGKTSPEELIAAAHASCFAMALALVLGENETPPEHVAVSAACALDEVDGAPRITTIELAVRAQVPGLEAADLERMVGRAGDLCPVANALRGNVKIDVRSELAPGHSSRPSHIRQEAEVEDIVRTLRGYGCCLAHGSWTSAERGTGPMGAAGEPWRMPSPAEGSDSSATTSSRSPTPRTDERPAP